MKTGIPIITATEEEIVIKKIPGVKIDANALNEVLLTLTADTYLALYHKMQEKVLGYSPFYNGCCVPATIENEQE